MSNFPAQLRLVGVPSISSSYPPSNRPPRQRRDWRSHRATSQRRTCGPERHSSDDSKTRAQPAFGIDCRRSTPCGGGIGTEKQPTVKGGHVGKAAGLARPPDVVWGRWTARGCGEPRKSAQEVCPACSDYCEGNRRWRPRSERNAGFAASNPIQIDVFRMRSARLWLRLRTISKGVPISESSATFPSRLHFYSASHDALGGVASDHHDVWPTKFLGQSNGKSCSIHVVAILITSCAAGISVAQESGQAGEINNAWCWPKGRLTARARNSRSERTECGTSSDGQNWLWVEQGWLVCRRTDADRAIEMASRIGTADG